VVKPIAASNSTYLWRRKEGCWLACILMAFFLLQCVQPLSTAILIGADEGFELAKATLCVHGYKLYSQVWNDQPGFHPFLLTLILKFISPSVLGPRLLTVCSGALLLASVFFLTFRFQGLITAVCATMLLMASPGFLVLSASCMLEIPALAPALAALAVLSIDCQQNRPIREILAGILFGIAFDTKLTNVILLPLAALIVWLRISEPPKRSAAHSLLWLLGSVAISFLAADLVSSGGSYLSHCRQAWVSHLGSRKSFDYGSPDDHPYGWYVLLRNWDTTIPAKVGVIWSLMQARKTPSAIIPVAWLGLSFAVFATYRPWWNYYYIHTAVPLCWCAGVGISAIFGWGAENGRKMRFVALLLYVLCVLPWVGMRMYVEIEDVRESPQTYSSLVLGQIEKYKHFTKLFYTLEPIYSFHAGIPMPPDLAVVSLKRFWAGEMTSARIGQEMQDLKPGIVLLRNDTHPTPFDGLIAREYRLVYEDGDHRLYINKSIVNKPAKVGTQ
jgi:hypothetical protein